MNKHKKCIECLRKPSPVPIGPIPQGWSRDFWRCYKQRRASKCKLHLTPAENLEKCFDAICLLVCGAEIHNKEQFQTCFTERCPVALKIEHMNFATNMDFQGYLRAQFRSLNPVILRKEASRALKIRQEREAEELSTTIPWVKYDGAVAK